MSVAIVMGSDSDESVMRQTAEALDEFGIAWEMRVLSAHRTPDDAVAYARGAAERGVQVIVAGAGGAAAPARRPRRGDAAAGDRGADRA